MTYSGPPGRSERQSTTGGLDLHLVALYGYAAERIVDALVFAGTQAAPGCGQGYEDGTAGSLPLGGAPLQEEARQEAGRDRAPSRRERRVRYP